MKSHPCNDHRLNVAQLFLIVFFATNFVSSSVASRIVVNKEEKVKLELYYEALCPDCEDFVVNYLYKIFENGLVSIVDLKLSPYGNAKISSDGSIVCQHGEWECLLNTVEACAIRAWPAVNDHFPFVYCMEKLNYDGKYKEWETCFEKLNLDPKPVTDCISSGAGHKLELQYGEEIKALEPAHTFVPWVVVDGQPLYDDYNNFISYICKAYKGSNIPQACLGLSLSVTAPKDSISHVYHINKENAKSKSTILGIISSTVASWMDHVGMAELI